MFTSEVLAAYKFMGCRLGQVFSREAGQCFVECRLFFLSGPDQFLSRWYWCMLHQ